MNAITEKELRQIIKVANGMLEEHGKLDCLCLDMAYGGYQIAIESKTHEYCVERTLTGFETKRVAYNFVRAYISGLSAR